MGDARAYDAWARRIAAGDWVGHDVFYQAPLYPYFLGALYSVAGRHLLAVRIAQAVIGSFACVLLARAGEQWFSRRAGQIAGFMLALYAPAIFFDGLLQKTVLDVFLVCLVLWLLSKSQWLATGLALGALALTRENALVFAALALMFAATRPQRLRNIGLVAAGLAIVLAPVVVRNRIVGGGYYVTTSQFGANFYMGNNARTDGTASSLRAGRGSAEFERIDATQLAEQARGRRLTPAEVSSFWTEQAMTFITSQHAAWLRLTLRKTALFWNRTEWLDTESQESYEDASPILRIAAIVGHFGVLVPLAWVGVLLTWRDRSRVWVLYAMTLGYAASVIIFYIYARYRFPVVPLLVLFAAAAAADWRRVATLRWPAVAGVAAAAVLANWPMLSADLMRAITENNLGAALADAGRMDEALAHYEKAVALRPDYAPAHNNIGVVLATRGRTDQAIAAYTRALSYQPYPDADYNIGSALLRDKRYAEAAEHFQRALNTDPGLPDAHNNLGIALAATGRSADAIVHYRQAKLLDAGNPQVRRNLADALAETGRMREAVDEMRGAVALASADGSLHYDLGSLLLDADQYEGAIAEFREAIRLMPASSEARNNLGIALASSGNVDAAIASFQDALTQAKTDQEKEHAQRNLQTALAARRGSK